MNSLTPAAEISCENYIRKHGTLAYKAAYYDIERYLKQGRRLSIITDKKTHGYTATSFHKINLLDRDHIAELLASDDLSFTDDIENQPHNMGWFASSKKVIKKILADVKPLFEETQKAMIAKDEAKAKAKEDTERQELEKLLSTQKRIAELQTKYGDSSKADDDTEGDKQ